MPKESRNRYRIIAGQWRGRNLVFTEGEGLRPTGDRIRETLFNWLQPTIAGARCLDAYSGSGALAFEALSRGAASVVTLDNAAVAVSELRRNAAELQAEGIEIQQCDARQWLQRQARATRFDIIFLDPPFALELLEASCRLIAAGELLTPAGQVYLESPQPLSGLSLPEGWRLVREKKAGQVWYGLATPDSPTIPDRA